MQLLTKLTGSVLCYRQISKHYFAGTAN